MNYVDSNSPLPSEDDILASMFIGQDVESQHHHNSHHNHQQPMTAGHSMAMDPMMSIEFQNFPVAFFNIFHTWQFIVLLFVCFIISFLTELARARNVLATLTKSADKTLAEKNIKQYSQLKEKLSRLDDFSDFREKIDAKLLNERNVKSAKLRRKLRRRFDTFMLSAPHNNQSPMPIGFGIRLVQFFYHFILTFIHFALMMAAMANIWALIVICLGAALGYMIGTWMNDIEAVRSYKCQSCLMSTAEEGCGGGDDSFARRLVIPRIEVNSEAETIHTDDADNEDDNSSQSSTKQYGKVYVGEPKARYSPPKIESFCH